MSTLLGIFNRIPQFSWNTLKKETREWYRVGYKVGKREALDCLIDRQKYNYKNLNEWEKATVIAFLEQNNLEFGYDFESGGFYVLKKIDRI